MQAVKRNPNLIRMAMLVCAVLCALAPNAAAASDINYSCDGISGVLPQNGSTPVSFSCAGASGSANMVTGVASVLADWGGYSALVGWSIEGTISGAPGSTGTITVSDDNITGVYADSGGNISLGISDASSPFTQSSACFNAGGTDGCEAYGTAVLSASLSVVAGEQVFLFFNMGCGTTLNPATGNCAVSDPVTLTLSPGLTFDSPMPGFLSGSAPPSPTPEPPSFLLLAAGGLVGLAGLRFSRGKTPSY